MLASQSLEELQRAFLALSADDRSAFVGFINRHQAGAVQLVAEPLTPAAMGDLCDSLHARILSHLSPWELARAAAVCRSFAKELPSAVMLRAERLGFIGGLRNEHTLRALVYGEMLLRQKHACRYTIQVPAPWEAPLSFEKSQALAQQKEYRRLGACVARLATEELKHSSSWQHTPLPSYTDLGVNQQWRWDADGSLVLTRSGQLDISWSEGGSAVHHFPVPLKPRAITVCMQADLPERDEMEGPGFVVFAPDHDATGLANGLSVPHGFLDFRLERDGMICVYDRYARRLTNEADGSLRFGEEAISARHPALFRRNNWKPGNPREAIDRETIKWKRGNWYKIVLDFDWVRHRVHVCADDLGPQLLPRLPVTHPEEVARRNRGTRRYIRDLFLPVQPLGGICCCWRSASLPEASVRWGELSVMM